MADEANGKVITKRYKGPNKLLGLIDQDVYESKEQLLETVK